MCLFNPKIIIDLIASSKEIIKFVKEKKGGKLREGSCYELINIPIGYRENLDRDILEFIRKNNVNEIHNYHIITSKA